MKRTLVLASLLLGAALPAQPKPGDYLAGLTVSIYTGTTKTANQGELYVCDPLARTATALTLPAHFATEGVNALLPINPVAGYLTTIAMTGSVGDLYSYVIAGTTVTVTKLNSAPFNYGTTPGPVGNLAQIGLLGGNIYIASQNELNQLALLWSVPAAGGPPTLEVDLSTLPGFNTQLANGMTVFGGKVYVATGFGTTPPAQQLWAFDPATKATKLVLDLPVGLAASSSVGPYVVNLGVDTKRNLIILMGVYGDVLWIDPAQAKVVKHVASGPWTASTSKWGNHVGLINSCVYNPDTDDVAIGSRDGSLDILDGWHSAVDFIVGLGSATTASYNSVTALAYLPVGAYCQSYGEGGMGSGGYYPVSASIGYPFAGQTWGLGLYGGVGGGAAFLLLGVSDSSWAGTPLPLNLGPFGAQGNYIYTAMDLSVAAVLAGSGNGAGTAALTFPLPAAVKGAVLFSQWLTVDMGANSLGLVMSNARKIMVK